MKMSISRRTFSDRLGPVRQPNVLPIAVFSFLLSAGQLPAPVHEEDDKRAPTASSEEPTKPKVRHKAEPKSDEVSKTSESKSTPRPSGKAKNLDGPSPQYPAEAGALHLSGVGIYLLHFDQSTGLVTDVTVVQSAGSPILDQAAITGFRQWHEDPNCAKEVTMTMTFTGGGVRQ